MNFTDRVLNNVYKKTVAFSYGMPGYRLQKKYWCDLDSDLSQNTYVVTGANSGIGKAMAQHLARRQARVILVCRNLEKGKQTQKELTMTARNRNVMLEIADLSKINDVERLAYRFSNWYPNIDCLIHNAGVMVQERETTDDDIERTFATNVVGPFLLTMRIYPLLEKSPNPHIIQVSSGGMYTQKIDVDTLQHGPEDYRGVKAYAQSKRAQVMLNKLWADFFRDKNITCSCMHPGWVRTVGLEKSLPRFNKIFAKILRTPDAGADTALWLATLSKPPQSGKLWFDRSIIPEHVSEKTKEEEGDFQKLWDLLKKLTKYEE
ncbi:SDR family NAD(P)-dependent oxidoreductase [Candidatus Uabimicrobium amorphum]|uniref:Retinol dehydrogenase n=1 Tax=Uabimicrobium amorphum TaxID=2596890 RepID=A0A5S9ILJ4_UABAM|nr:SDR family NAD(P)-dependent oxidoreductase [Candidatus Uabimicrobium amorphum]BBM83770.1 retinol dehydrogenase [Candidatus Uabimicrobium amorphum]